MKCDLCEEEVWSIRGETFGKKQKSICADCLAQWKIEGGRIVLRGRKS